MSNKIFAFWESKEEIPAYLELCKQTWIKNIPDLEIHILNHNNLNEYIGDVYDISQLKKISFPMQSDIISAAVLEKFGGLFIDLDCIVTDDIFKIFNNISTDKLVGFGYPNKGMHLAVLYCGVKNNPILTEWRKESQKRLKNLPENYDWSYFGNAILNPLLQNELYKNNNLIIDRTISGNILESKAMMLSQYTNSKEYYINFYFNKYFRLDVNDVVNLIEFGVVSLHNSWTPSEYKKIKKIETFLEQKIPLTALLQYILKNSTEMNLSIYYLELLLESKLKNYSYFLKKGYFKEKLVFDFQFNDIKVGVDIYKSDYGFNLELVIRNEGYKKIIESLSSSNLNFIANKAVLLKNAQIDTIVNKVFDVENFLNL